MDKNTLALTTKTHHKLFELKMPEGATYQDLKECCEQIVGFYEHGFGNTVISP